MADESVPDPDERGLASEVRAEFAAAMLPEGRDFAGAVGGSVAVETVERDDGVYGVAVDGTGRRIVSSLVVDLEGSA